MDNLKSMDDVLERLKALNEKKLEEMMNSYGRVRAKRKRERLVAPINDIPEVVEKASQSSAVDASMDQWLKLLNELGRK
ncbi:hypothetical protein [Paenibacillus marinisediminis]